jgi:hypothetical protein
MVERKRLRLVLLLFGIIFPTIGFTTEYEPWLGNFGELEWRSDMRFQTYHHLLEGDKARPYASDDLFLETGLGTTIFNFGLEVEAIGANTRRQSGIDQIKATIRYNWFNDVAGDPLSLMTGFSFDQCSVDALHDPSSFHHGRAEAECFVSMGKEFAYDFYDDLLYDAAWSSRVWAMGAIGASPDKGSPWCRATLAYEKRFLQKHQLKLFVNGLYGYGGRNLDLDDFHGYGPLRHESVNVGFRYSYLIDLFGTASLEYSNRVYARNFPANVSQIMLQVLYPFGL